MASLNKLIITNFKIYEQSTNVQKLKNRSHNSGLFVNVKWNLCFHDINLLFIPLSETWLCHKYVLRDIY